MKLLTDLTVESATEAQLTEALFIITGELDKRHMYGHPACYVVLRHCSYN